MKSYKRYLSLLLCLPLLFGLFSTTANADSVDTSAYKMHMWVYFSDGTSFGQIEINNGENQWKEVTKDITFKSGTNWFYNRHTFTDTSGAIMMKSGRTYTFRAENLRSKLYYDVDGAQAGNEYPKQGLQYFRLTYEDATTEDIPISNVELIYNSTTKTYSINAKVTPAKNVYKITFSTQYKWDTNDILNNTGINLVGTKPVTAVYGADSKELNPLKLNVEISSEEAGLLSGLIGWVQNIFSSITDGFANIGQWFAELPGKLWSAIENGLKGLFVPDDAYMQGYKDKWDQLLESRLGAVYQVCDIVVSSWDNIMNSDQTNSISIPKVTIPLGNSSFSFGGYNVQIVPDGFDALVTAVKIICGIVCTYLFINGLLKRYDEVMGVEQ